MPTYTWDQIADYLQNGYWASEGSQAQTFALGASRQLTYDVSRLSTSAQVIATAALNSWSSVTGINFLNVGTAPTNVTESSDAGLLSATSYTISSNSIVAGNIAAVGDVDDYRVTLTAGQSYLIGLSNYPGKTLGDPTLTLLDASGNVIQTIDSDDPAAGEYLTYTATSTGTYYIRAAGFNSTTGSYDLSVQTAAQITFNDMDQTGAYDNSDLVGNTITRSYVNIADNWDALTMNGYMLQTYIHEIGHALGLGHAGPYNGNAVFGTNNIYDNDSWLATVMSYFNQTENTTNPNDSLAYLATIMPADIIAIQNMYGAGSTGYQTGNTVWGPGGNVGGYLQTMLNMLGGLQAADPLYYQSNPIAATIYDTAGNDTIDASAFSQNQEILLTELQYSNIGGLVDNIVIARGTVIENAIGGAGVDTIIGNDVANVLEGRGGGDTLNGGNGNDTASYAASAAAVTVNLITGAGTGGDAQGDVLVSIENVIGSGLDDTFIASSVANAVNGGNGNDTVSYASSAAGVTVNLSAGTGAGGDAQGDTFVSVENVIGSGLADTVVASLVANILNGGAGSDTISYAGSAAAVTVNLIAGTGAGGDAQGDSLTSFENVIGSAFSDSFVANAVANAFTGGAGTDSVSYANSAAGVLVNLQTGTGSAGDSNGDTYVSIENITGSALGDSLKGDGNANILSGGAGNDLLISTAGQDTLDGGADLDTVDYSTYANGVSINLATGAGGDGALLQNIENVTGTAFGDVLAGDAGANTMKGGAGNDFLVAGNGADFLDGQGDLDTVSYSTATGGVFVNLGTGVGANGGVLANIENILGSAFGDVLYGDNGANTINGGAGNDFIFAGNGADNMIGGADLDTVSYETATTGVFANLATGIGANGGVLSEIENLTGSNFGDVLYGSAIGNTIKGGAGNDFIVGGAGSDALYGGADADTFRYEAAGYGGDVIVDFQDGVDKLSFATTLATSFSNFTVAGNGTTSVTLTLAGQAIVVQGAAAITLDAGDFLFV